MTSAPTGIVGVGYEGRTVRELVTALVAAGVSRVIDVRLNPVSRKPGLSKTALGSALAEAGIAYEHRRELGNPKANRPGFGGTPAELAAAKRAYRALLTTPDADRALTAIAEAGRSELVAVLCFEADQDRCHRDVVLRETWARSPSVGEKAEAVGDRGGLHAVADRQLGDDAGDVDARRLG